ncbi:hypothetical protein GCM10022252_51010 [Streptosporangium oxazolinicum]|uniref:DUF6879 domain-containing protein n=1 Tax=Streptosporangium oxazolinicum TaxID=909287 RepID=A0ABP8B6P7_9ACTN
MEPITYEQFKNMFHSSRRAWHLELRDVYNVETEEIPFGKWLKGESDDLGWHQEWLDHLREVTTLGVRVERLRIVTEPHTRYIRWEMTLNPGNIEAGEEIRYLPRHEAEDIGFPAEDCWLFDDDGLVLSLFEPDGRSGGFALEDDPELIARYRTVRDQAWSRGIPHAVYVTE